MRSRVPCAVLAALLVLGACADDREALPPRDAAAPAAPSSTLDAATSRTADAGTPVVDAASPSVSDARSSSTTEAGPPEASTADAVTPGADDAAAPDASTSPEAGAATGARPLSTGVMLTNSMESPGVEPFFDVFRPTDMAAAVAATGRPLPVIVWANGGCFRSVMTWAPLFKRWAAAGFVVVALSVKPGGGLLDMLGTTTQVEHGKLIDWALEQAKKQGSPYAGMLDADSVVAAGNSCGGVTAMELTAKDARVRATFVLSGSSAVGNSNVSVVNAIKVPVGFVVGNPDEDIAAPNAMMDYEKLPAGLSAMVVNRSSGDHMKVSTDTMVLPEVAEIALNWLDLSLYGNKQAAAALRSPNVCTSCTPVWKLTSKNLEKLEK